MRAAQEPGVDNSRADSIALLWMNKMKRPIDAAHTQGLKLIFLLAPLFLVTVLSVLARNYQLDDALIYLRYIRNFHEGHGLVYNPGERFNGLTSPLYTWLLLFASFVIRNLQVLSIAVSGVFLLAASLLGAKLFARNQAEAIVTAVLLAAFAYFYSTFGMETTLFLFLIAASLYLYRQNSSWFLVTLALLAITRYEGVFLGLVLGVDFLLRHRRLPALRFLAAAVVIFLLPFVFNFLYYGEALPSSSSAKIGQGQSGLWGERFAFFQLDYLVPLYFRDNVYVVLALAGLAVAGIISCVRDRTAGLTLVFAILLLMFYTVLNIPNYHWYYAPFMYLGLLFACRGFFSLLALLPVRQSPLRSALAGVPLVVIAFWAAATIIYPRELGHDEGYATVGRWLKENTPPDATIGVVEIGAIGWYSERPVIDILGLVNPLNAEYIARRQLTAWLQHYQPDYLLRHDPVWPHERSIFALEQEGLYVPVPGFPRDGGRLLMRAEHVSADTVRAFAYEVTQGEALMRRLHQSSPVGAPAVILQGTHLFAHAPITLEITVEEAAATLETAYGVETGAEGLHNELCFEISNLTQQAVLLLDCIAQATSAQQMRRSEEIPTSIQAGDTLQFRIDCPQGCDYAWTYWDRVLLEKKRSDRPRL